MSEDKNRLPTERHSAEVADFLEKLKQAPAAHTGGGRGRLIFALDATASREPTWDRACRIQGEMFEATAALGGLEIQLVYYRGFSECKASRWMTTAAHMRRRRLLQLFQKLCDLRRVPLGGKPVLVLIHVCPHAGRSQTEVSWKTAPPRGRPGSALVNRLIPIPSSNA